MELYTSFNYREIRSTCGVSALKIPIAVKLHDRQKVHSSHPHFRFHPSDARQRDLETAGSFECKFRSRRYRFGASRASRGILLVLATRRVRRVSRIEIRMLLVTQLTC